jgi:ABC-type Zn uptake system ZnuABC Zn-binding protein ZnuA
MEMRAGVAPDPNEFRKLVQISKAKNVRVIAIEPQYSSEAAERLREGVAKAGGAGLTIIEIDPLETAQPDDFSAAHQFGKDFYERKMMENVNNLRDAWK